MDSPAGSASGPPGGGAVAVMALVKGSRGARRRRLQPPVGVQRGLSLFLPYPVAAGCAFIICWQEAGATMA
ncbi:MAG: hypothetical protein J3K34DRAFT_438189 [Monoraphidium minutum]|nr:MAG: hypothetical protein J3K34DRAFT_438189 [Monoraphidium minutum]